MAVDSVPLVGRGRELALLGAAVASIGHGPGRVVVVSGPAGIGKTRLLAEAARLASDGATVLQGRASELERMVPFSVAVDALDDYLRALPADALSGLTDEDRAELALVLPALRGGSPTGPASPDDRVRAYFAIRRLLDELARDHPLLLVLDDLHWADRSSTELLSHLVRRPPTGPVLIIAAYRPAQADDDLLAALTRAQHEGTATYVEPAPLTAPEVSELLAVTGAECERLHHLSGGNPFLLLEIARAGAAAGVAGGTDLPSAVSDAIVAGLAPLSPDARALAEAAAAVGDPFEVDLAFAAAGLSEVVGLDALDELARHDLVTRTDVPRRFAWRHPLVRHAVYESLLPGRRLATHQRCAALLAEHGAPAAELAVHVEASARPGDPAAVAVLSDAARESAARAPASAVRWLRAARRLMPADAPATERLALLERLAPLHSALGEIAEARACLVEALPLVPPDDVARRTRLATACAGTEQALGDHDASHARLERTLAELPAGASRESVDLMIALAMDSFFRKERQAMQGWGLRAVELAADWGDLPRLAAAHGARAMALALSAEVAEAEQELAAAVDLVDRLTDEEVAERVDALGSVAGAELYLDRYVDAVKHAERGVRIARATGTLMSAPTLIPTLGTSLWVVGRIADSIRVIEESTEAARASRDRQGIAWQLFNLAYAQLHKGDLESALRSSSESLEIGRELQDSFVTSWSGAIGAAVRLELGDPTAALRMLDETSGGPGLETLPGGWRCHFFEVATRAWLDLDRPDRARETAERSVDWGAIVGLPHGQCTAARGMARWAVARGDAATAVAQASAAVGHAERATARYDAAISRMVLGQALRLANRREEAVAELREAASRLDAMGALRYRDEAERELGRLGSRPHRRTTPGAGGSGMAALTRRELEVARLVADRRTNPEVAAALFLSIKTVETHLRNIFRKLDVDSRADLARVLDAATVGDGKGARR